MNEKKVAWNKGLVGVIKMSEETKELMRKIRTGTKHSEETKKRLAILTKEKLYQLRLE